MKTWICVFKQQSAWHMGKYFQSFLVSFCDMVVDADVQVEKY